MLLHSLENGKEEEEGEINIELYYVEVCSTYAEEGGGGESTALGEEGRKKKEGEGKNGSVGRVVYIRSWGRTASFLHFVCLFLRLYAHMPRENAALYFRPIISFVRCTYEGDSCVLAWQHRVFILSQSLGRGSLAG